MAAYKPYLKKLGVTYLQYLVLLVLWEQQKATITEICQALGLDTGTVSPLIKRMEKLQLLIRQRSIVDERVVEVVLTTIGEGLQEQANEIPKHIGACLFGNSDGAYTQLREVLDTTLERVKNFSC